MSSTAARVRPARCPGPRGIAQLYTVQYIGQRAIDSTEFPAIVIPPEHERPDAPVVVAWHLADPPSSETAMAAALPLAGLDAWRVYLGLPMHSSRSIDPDEYMRLAYEDAVVNHFGPITAQARAEFPAAYAELADRFGFSGPLALLGGSLGSAVAQLVAVDRDDVVAEVLVSPVATLRSIVAANERRFGVTYPWHPAATKIADELDFVARADETTVPVQIIVGERGRPGHPRRAPPTSRRRCDTPTS